MSGTEGWELGTQLIGGEVKQVLGLESDRSSLTGVGLILREGFVLLSGHRFLSNSYLPTCPLKGGGRLQSAPHYCGYLTPNLPAIPTLNCGAPGPNFLTPLAQPLCHPARGGGLILTLQGRGAPSLREGTPPGC